MTLPWGTFQGEDGWKAYFTDDSFPSDFHRLPDPSKINRTVADKIIAHWRDRVDQEEPLPVVVFKNLPEPAKKAGTTGPKRGRKKRKTGEDVEGRAASSSTVSTGAKTKGKAKERERVSAKGKGKQPARGYVDSDESDAEQHADQWPDRLARVRGLLPRSVFSCYCCESAKHLCSSHRIRSCRDVGQFLDLLKEFVGSPQLNSAIDCVLPLLVCLKPSLLFLIFIERRSTLSWSSPPHLAHFRGCLWKYSRRKGLYGTPFTRPPTGVHCATF